MEKIFLQLWETFEEGQHQSDGCSLHLSINDRNTFVDIESIEKYVGLPSEVHISDSIFELLKSEKNIRLSEIEMNNLISLKDIRII